MMQLVKPAAEHLPGYIASLKRGWSPDNLRPEAAHEQLEQIASDADSFLAGMDDPEARGPIVTLPDGSQVKRIPSLRRWMWDDGSDASDEPSSAGFIGSIGLRWIPGGAALPAHVLGHIGYAVVPWQQRRGHATRALGLLLPLAREQGQSFVEITTDPENIASQSVITRNGGVLMGAFNKGEAYGLKPGLRFRIELGGRGLQRGGHGATAVLWWSGGTVELLGGLANLPV